MSLLARTTLAVLALLAAVACGDEGADDYSLEVEQQFVDDCTASAGRAECRCLYRRISETVPFDRFEDLDARVAETGGELPEEIEELALECAASVSSGG